MYSDVFYMKSKNPVAHLLPLYVFPFYLRVQVTNWLPRAGKAKITYAGGSTFEGVFNGERIKEGQGKYTWMKPAEEDGEDPQASLVLYIFVRCGEHLTLRALPPLRGHACSKAFRLYLHSPLLRRATETTVQWVTPFKRSYNSTLIYIRL